MNCHNIRELLPSLVYGELPDEDSAAVRHHLDRCPSCEEEHRGLLRLRRSLDLVVADESRVDLSRLYRQAFETDQRRARRWRRAALAFLAAAAGLLILVFARLEVRVEGHQLTFRWGSPPEQHQAITTPATASPRPSPGVRPEDFEALRQLVHAAIDDAHYRDEDRQTAILELAAKLEWLEAAYLNARQDIRTLYIAHSGTLEKGDQR